MAERMIKVWEVLFDGREDGPSGPAGDGTFIERFRSQRDADAFPWVSHEVARELVERGDVVPGTLTIEGAS